MVKMTLRHHTNMEKAGLYVHVPFCRSKCPYCDFFSIPTRSLVPRWIEALLEEAALAEGIFDSFDSLYLGGGTPSVLTPQELEPIVQALNARFSFSPNAETTIELNPEDVTPERLRALKALGFNRISLGVQSLEEADLAFLGRRHGVLHCLRSIEWIREAGFRNLSVDLMYGLKTQSPGGWRRTLERVLPFSPEHISCYQLTVKPHTAFARLQQEGRLGFLGEEGEKEFYDLSCSVLEGAGYVHYEVSNFARGEPFRSRHNAKYWHHVPYLGLGPSAHSFDGRSRWWNERSVKGYCRALSRRRLPVEGRETLSKEQLRLERLLLGFRTQEGFSLELLEGCQNAGRILMDLEEEGLISLGGGTLVPTREGFLVADSLPLLFL